jgi:chemotaxis protein methyltransferase CheR
MQPRATSEAARPGAIKHTPPPADAYQSAIDLLRDGKADEALIKLYEKLDHDPEFVPTYYTLGKIYANKGNLEEAQNWCERAVNKDRLHPEPYYTLALIYQQHGMIDMALTALKKATFLDREFILAHYNLAQLYQHQHDLPSARRSLQNALRLLDGKPLDLAIPEGDGLAVGRLRELIENELSLMK